MILCSANTSIFRIYVCCLACPMYEELDARLDWLHDNKGPREVLVHRFVYSQVCNARPAATLNTALVYLVKHYACAKERNTPEVPVPTAEGTGQAIFKYPESVPPYELPPIYFCTLQRPFSYISFSFKAWLQVRLVYRNA
eukprot:6192835-Pleurochrysis_carterae.AAC.1